MSLLEGQVKACCPVRWLDHGRQAIVVLPEHVDLSVAGPILEETLDRIASRIFEVGIVLSTAVSMPPGGLEEKVDEAVRLLEDMVSGIYDAALGSGRAPDDPGRGSGNADQQFQAELARAYPRKPVTYGASGTVPAVTKP